jgi:hypothetical protein
MWYLQLFSYFITSLFCTLCFWFSWETLRDSQQARKWARSRQEASRIQGPIIVHLSVSDRLTARQEAEAKAYRDLLDEIREITA